MNMNISCNGSAPFYYCWAFDGFMNETSTHTLQPSACSSPSLFAYGFDNFEKQLMLAVSCLSRCCLAASNSSTISAVPASTSCPSFSTTRSPSRLSRSRSTSTKVRLLPTSQPAHDILHIPCPFIPSLSYSLCYPWDILHGTAYRSLGESAKTWQNSFRRIRRIRLKLVTLKIF